MILGLCGHAGSGKDTAADYLVERRGFVKVALADPMKRFCREVFGFSEEQLWGPSEKRNALDRRYLQVRRGAHGGKSELRGGELVELEAYPPEDVYLSPRVALQFLGTEVGRHLYENVWIDYGLRVARCVELGAPYDPVLSVGCIGLNDKPRGVVISDVRFPNEGRRIIEEGGKVLRLVRAGCSGAVGLAGHASEAQHDQVPVSLTLEVPEGIPAFHQALDRALVEMGVR